MLPACSAVAGDEDAGELLRTAARNGDAEQVRALLEAGTDIDAATQYGATALSYACDKGRLEVVRLLVERGANINQEDTFYGATPVTWAAYNGHAKVVRFLIGKGAKGASGALMMGLQRDHVAVVEAVAGSGALDADELSRSLMLARQSGSPAMVAALEKAGAKEPTAADATVDPAVLESYVGTYTSDLGTEATATLEDGVLKLDTAGQPTLVLGAVDETTFRPEGAGHLTVTFERSEGYVTGFTVTLPGGEIKFERVEKASTGEE